MAAKAGASRTAYALMLFEAAYAARCGVETGDRDLDAMVAATLLLHGIGLDAATISQTLGTTIEIVERIIRAWIERDNAS